MDANDASDQDRKPTSTHPFGTNFIFIELRHVKPGVGADARTKPLPLANGRGCYKTVTPERARLCPLENGRYI
jgi:hypothetical protein